MIMNFKLQAFNSGSRVVQVEHRAGTPNTPDCLAWSLGAHCSKKDLLHYACGPTLSIQARNIDECILSLLLLYEVGEIELIYASKD